MKNMATKASISAAFKSILFTVVFIFIYENVPRAMSYNLGRLGGAEPSADYLRQNPKLLSHSMETWPERAAKGSGKFTLDTFYKNVKEGDVFWDGTPYEWVLPESRDLPTVCTNFVEHRSNTSVTKLGFFICPMVQDPSDMHYCCGEEDQEYCCNLVTAQIFYYQKPTLAHHLEPLKYMGFFLAALAIPFIILAVCYCIRRNNGL